MINDKRIEIEILNGVKDLNILQNKNLDEIEELFLIVFKKISLRFLKKFKNLKKIGFAGSVIKDYSVLIDCLNLEYLLISSSNIKNLDFIETLKIKNLNLELMKSKEIEDLSFLKNTTTIESITLFDVNIKELTNFSKLKNLKHFSIRNCKYLTGISDLQTAKTLEVLEIAYDRNTGKSKFEIKKEVSNLLKKLPNLKKLIVGNMIYEEINCDDIINELKV